MNNLAAFFLCLTALVIVASPASAADKQPQFTYEGAVTGVVCVSCKDHVTLSLTRNLPGTVKVDVKKGKTDDAQRLILVSTNENVTVDAANKALGTFSKLYKILSLTRKE